MGTCLLTLSCEWLILLCLSTRFMAFGGLGGTQPVFSCCPPPFPFPQETLPTHQQSYKNRGNTLPTRTRSCTGGPSKAWGRQPFSLHKLVAPTLLLSRLLGPPRVIHGVWWTLFKTVPWSWQRTRRKRKEEGLTAFPFSFSLPSCLFWMIHIHCSKHCLLFVVCF